MHFGKSTSVFEKCPYHLRRERQTQTYWHDCCWFWDVIPLFNSELKPAKSTWSPICSKNQNVALFLISYIRLYEDNYTIKIYLCITNFFTLTLLTASNPMVDTKVCHLASKVTESGCLDGLYWRSVPVAMSLSKIPIHMLLSSLYSFLVWKLLFRGINCEVLFIR